VVAIHFVSTRVANLFIAMFAKSTEFNNWFCAFRETY